MKGFLGAFLIFIFWASGGIYYVNKTGTNAVQKEVTRTNKIPTTVKDKVPTNSLQISSQEIEVNAQDKKEDLVTDSIITSKTTSNSQLLAAELKKSIAISDTIDIDTGEPALNYENEIALPSDEKLSSNLFYPRYTSSSELILDKKLVEYAGELKKLLKENPDKKVTIVGHTDNIGNARDNFTAALKKSRQVKWYLTARRGIPRSFITATSRGEEEPIESNKTKWGRKKNNRIEIIID